MKSIRGYKIEERSGVKVLVSEDGSVRPATDAEVIFARMIEVLEVQFDTAYELLKEAQNKFGIVPSNYEKVLNMPPIVRDDTTRFFGAHLTEAIEKHADRAAMFMPDVEVVPVQFLKNSLQEHESDHSDNCQCCQNFLRMEKRYDHLRGFPQDDEEFTHEIAPKVDAGNRTLNQWPDNIVADRHDVTGKWVLHYLTDEQAAKCREALKQREMIVVDDTTFLQSGGLTGPDNAIAHYTIREKDSEQYIVFGSEERPANSPMYVDELRRAIGIPYSIVKPENGWRDISSFSSDEKKKLRPIAETLAMLDGNAFFGNTVTDDREWYESYLPEAAALYENNGGDTGWGGRASFIKRESGTELPKQRGTMFGQACPKGKVMLEFVSLGPRLRQIYGDSGDISHHSYYPADFFFLEIYVDGQRFRIDVGDCEQSGGGKDSRGLHIIFPFKAKVEGECVNALNLVINNEIEDGEGK